MSSNKTKLDMLFTVNNNIKCLDNKKDNKFIIKNDKIFFKNNHINQNLDTNMIALYKGKFNISTDNGDLMLGVNNLNNKINDNGNYYVKTATIDNVSVNLYKSSIELEVFDIIPSSKLYVFNSENRMYEIKIIYNESCREEACNTKLFQSYNINNFGEVKKASFLNSLTKELICSKSNSYRIRKLNNQQNLYTMMRLYPHKFPIISKVQNLNLTYAQKRSYSNMWWRQFGTSQALPVNDNFGGFNLVGSEVRYTS